MPMGVPMADLAKLIDEAARSGGLTALTVWPCAGGWQCNVRRGEGWRCVTVPRDEITRGLLDAVSGPVRTGVQGVSETSTDEDIFG